MTRLRLPPAATMPFRVWIETIAVILQRVLLRSEKLGRSFEGLVLISQAEQLVFETGQVEGGDQHLSPRLRIEALALRNLPRQ